MSWWHGDIEIVEPPDDILGFVYCITNKLTGRMYIGKKLFSFRHRRVVKGKKKTVLKESDWQKYYSSSEELKRNVTEFGPENFHRQILHFCKNKGELSYLELREQMDRRALEYPDLYYNGFVGGKIHRNHIKKWLTTKINNLP